MGELDAVAEGAAGGENGIPQAHGANLYAEIDSVCGTHFGKSLPRRLVGRRLAGAGQQDAGATGRRRVRRRLAGVAGQQDTGAAGGWAECGGRSRGRARAARADLLWLSWLDQCFAIASARTWPSREANVMPHSDARVGAMSAGVAWLRYSPC